jgi:hypothetical protein
MFAEKVKHCLHKIWHWLFKLHCHYPASLKRSYAGQVGWQPARLSQRLINPAGVNPACRLYAEGIAGRRHMYAFGVLVSLWLRPLGNLIEIRMKTIWLFISVLILFSTLSGQTHNN